MNRIDKRFAELRNKQQKGFVVYIGAGDPTLAVTEDLALAFDELGVDVLELGIPFSDPLADGLVNQLAAQRGLESGTTPPKALAAIKRIRERSQIPIVLYIYFNLLHKCGVKEFIRAAADAGVDGLLTLDLPPEESGDYEAMMREAGLAVIYLIAPTTPKERVSLIAKRGSGFIYYVSREGVTGMQTQVASNISAMTAAIRAHTDLPIAVGFGISNSQQAAAVAANCDAIVVGSAIVDQIAKHGRSADVVAKVVNFTRPLIEAARSALAPTK